MMLSKKLFTGAVANGAVVIAAGLLCGGVVRGDITGSVKLEGKAPDMPEINMKAVAECAKKHKDPVYEETVVVGEKGELANVVVALKPDDPSALGGEPRKEDIVLDQKGCQYFPHVIAMQVGQPMKVKNDDEFQHNVHSLAQTNPSFNFSQPNKDDGKPVDPPKATETYKVKCDVHPWMNAWVVVFDHPFFATTGEDGKFDIKGTVPDGDYKVMAWHEKYGTQEGTVTVKDGKGEVNFTFKAEGARGPQSPVEPKLASATQVPAEKSMSCCSGEKSSSSNSGEVASSSK